MTADGRAIRLSHFLQNSGPDESLDEQLLGFFFFNRIHFRTIKNFVSVDSDRVTIRRVRYFLFPRSKKNRKYPSS